MKNLYIVGAGGFGRELYGWINQSPEFKSKYKILGFLDDNSQALERFGNFADVFPLKIIRWFQKIFIYVG
jgi:FlaA1/EpsC-like NDP-sugar epimerase